MEKTYLQRLLGEKEEIQLVTRQHWSVLAQEILLEALSAIIMVVVISVILVKWVPDPRIAWAYLVVILPLISLLRDLMIWYNHQYIVTNRRVIQIIGVFSKNVTDSSLEKVNDVKMSQSFFGRVFDYADIEILTASETGVNRFTRIGNPIAFKTAMINAKERLEHISETDNTSSEDIPDLISKLDILRQQKVLTDEEFQRKKADLLAKL